MQGENGRKVRQWRIKMVEKGQTEGQGIETVEPICLLLGKRVLIRKDEDKKQTKGGIQLPDNIPLRGDDNGSNRNNLSGG